MLNYSISLYNANGDIIATETAAAAFQYVDGKPTNTIYATAAAMVKETPTAAAFRVYPLDNVMLALRCAKHAAAVAANKGGKAASVNHGEKGTPTAKKAANKAAKQTAAARFNYTQATIDADMRRIAAGLAAALCDNAELNIPEYVFRHIATANAHSQDFFSVCMLAAIEASGTPTEKTAAIYAAANRWIYANRTAAARELSTEYIIKGGGDIVSWGTAAAYILQGGEKWTPTAAANMGAETAAALGECLAAAFATLTPTDRKIVRYIVNGYGQSQTAAALHYANKSTINRKLAIIRKTFSDHIAANYPQFMGIVKQAETAAAATAAERGHDTTAAERMRRYRERKAAEKAATANA